MKCPHPNCGVWTRVLQTKARSRGKVVEHATGVRRRYECANLHRFSTLETVVAVDGAEGVLPSAARLANRNASIRHMLQTKSVSEVAAHFKISRITVWRATKKEQP